ncbi:MAG: C2HC-type zinc finger protein, partial [Sedimenticola sp.]
KTQRKIISENEDYSQMPIRSYSYGDQGTIQKGPSHNLPNYNVSVPERIDAESTVRVQRYNVNQPDSDNRVGGSGYNETARRNYTNTYGEPVIQGESGTRHTNYNTAYNTETVQRPGVAEFIQDPNNQRMEQSWNIPHDFQNTNKNYESRYRASDTDRLQVERTGYRRPMAYGMEETEEVSYRRSAPTSGHTLHGPYSQAPCIRGNLKLPAFTGKEDWKVWICRFVAIAERRNWSDEDKLDELLPRLQGGAGEFVFTQLPRRSLRSYDELVMELGYRYRVIENAKSYAAMFASRNQKQCETVEEYAAELKRLHYKAYPNRDKLQRRDDLVERFMRGIADEEVRFLVNFMKKPADIDEAVFCVVECKSERSSSRHQEPYGERKVRKFLRRTQPSETENESEDEADKEIEDRILRLDKRVRQTQAKQTKGSDNEEQNIVTKSDPAGKSDKTSSENLANDRIIQCLQQLTDRIKQLEHQVGTGSDYTRNNASRSSTCFKCGKDGHYAKWCPSARNNSRFNEQQRNYNQQQQRNYNQHTDRERYLTPKQEQQSLNFRGRPQ